MGAHALLSPSGASRWLACPRSARDEEQYPSYSNDAADEGTLAHAISELYLRNHLKLVKSVPFNSELKKLKANKFYNAEMDGHCVDYVDFILTKLGELHDPTIFVEEKIDLREYVPEGFGTVDCVMIADGILDINDLKYGKGVLVEVHENKQMMLYALGAVRRYSLLYSFDTVRMTIYQPRLNNYSSYEMKVADLLKWGEDYVKPQAKLAWEGKGNYNAGSHCRFCKARNACKALMEKNMEVAKYAFEEPNKMTDADIASVLEKAADIKIWLSGLQDYTLAEAVNNQKKWPGFKLVAGRSNRQYANAEAIQKALKKAKIDSALYLTEPKLVGIGALEKNVGKEKVEKLVGQYIVKPQGAATLVPEWDKRPELNSADAAKVAFADIETDQ